MTKSNDFTKMLQDMMASFPLDTSALQNAFKTQAAFSERLAKVNLEAAEKSTELAARWTQENLAKLAEITRAKTDPAEYSKAVADYVNAAAALAAENMAAFAELAKKVQTETVELMLAAGKEATEETTAAATKVANDLAAAGRKSSATAK